MFGYWTVVEYPFRADLKKIQSAPNFGNDILSYSDIVLWSFDQSIKFGVVNIDHCNIDDFLCKIGIIYSHKVEILEDYKYK